MRNVVRWPVTGVLTLVGVAILPMASSSQELLPIDGNVYIAGRPPIDPPPGAGKNTHAYLTIRGRGAVRMYQAMTAVAESDLCRGEGWKIKRAGDFACAISSDGRKAECDFSVELRRGLLAPGNPC